jgi:hypothetical protein
MVALTATVKAALPMMSLVISSYAPAVTTGNTTRAMPRLTRSAPRWVRSMVTARTTASTTMSTRIGVTWVSHTTEP